MGNSRIKNTALLIWANKRRREVITNKGTGSRGAWGNSGSTHPINQWKARRKSGTFQSGFGCTEEIKISSRQTFDKLKEEAVSNFLNGVFCKCQKG